ncbi:folP [Wigglesworthia glossinidia endosymbiont of Glossina brevipalpis]|uniref:dihydropteroate synthase n=1 Tax=Wigglesworthia glossinidia brevipalpis TaxID=36870 RepID=Q8D2X2_WIGBR|nr:folP [Wigglesworthia glossinidia endosymbiont of Glossina brevipalpis]
MGILNVTSDSFSDGGKFINVKNAIKQVSKMILEGASIIDVGGESSRPGAKRVSEKVEESRVIPIIKEIIKEFNIIVSINTSRQNILTKCIDLGVHMINDIRSLREFSSLHVISKSDIMICLMHMRGSPRFMQKKPKYNCILSEIKKFFEKKINFLKSKGISKDRIIIDPGFGFGKTINHNFTLLSNLGKFKSFNIPILVGMSRKSMTDENNLFTPESRLSGSISCAILSLIEGASIIRAHDVKETIVAIDIFKKFILAKKNLFYGK